MTKDRKRRAGMALYWVNCHLQVALGLMKEDPAIAAELVAVLKTVQALKERLGMGKERE